MKKVLISCLSLVMVAAMSLPSFAALGGFVSSPGAKKGPELIDYENSNHECTAEIEVTPYTDRHTLPDEKRDEIEDAYTMIVNSTDVTALNDDLADLAEDNGIDGKKLAVSDLFDVSYYSCDNHSEHGTFTITIKPETLENFVGLMYFDGEKWELVSDAKVEQLDENDVLTFTTDGFSPFAIVVNTDTTPVQTGDSFQWILYIVLMVVSASAMIFIGFRLRKQED